MLNKTLSAIEVPNRTSSLGALSDPNAFHSKLDTHGMEPKVLLKNLQMLFQIRKAEEKIGDMVASGKIGCPCHLAIGQEAVAIGVSNSLNKGDRIFGAHRSHAHYLAAGGSLFSLFSEVLGKDSGCAKGMGGSMHLVSLENGFMGSVPIVAGTVPIAVGAALAAKKDKKGQVAISYLGDGAMEEGCVHESLNLAAAFNLPILFVCENNLFSSHLHINLRQPNDSVARFAKAHHIPHDVIDGNDLVKVTRVASEHISRARSGHGPGFIEAVTYRWRGHVGPKEDTDVGVKRNVELDKWKKRDPISRLVESLTEQKFLTLLDVDNLKAEVDFQIEAEWKRAEAAPFPPLENLLATVYKT